MAFFVVVVALFVVVMTFLVVVVALFLIVVVALFLIVVVALFLIVVMAFLVVVHMDFAFHSQRRVSRFHDNRRNLVFDGVNRPFHPGLETDPIHHDHVGVAERPQFGGRDFVAVRLDAGANEHVDLGPVSADTLGEVPQRVDRGDDREALRTPVAGLCRLGGGGRWGRNGRDWLRTRVAIPAGRSQDQHAEERGERDAEPH